MNIKKTPENIVLIGFMGTGKSTIAKKLSKSLGYTLVDTDKEIEKKEQERIANIFTKKGEQEFRAMELSLLRNLTASKPCKHLISTGGGIITNPECLPLIKSLGYVVWLIAPPATILERTSRNKDRPLLQTQNPLQAITELLQKREPLYRECADLELETEDLSFGEITAGITESARYYFAPAQ